MQKGMVNLWRLLAVFLVAAMGAAAAGANEVPLITKEELKSALGSGHLTIIDVRAGQDWAGSDKKIPGAVREDPAAVDSWAKKYPPHRDIVLYCA